MAVTAQLAVLDGSTPERWSPWGTPMTEWRVRIGSLQPYGRKSVTRSFGLDLIVHPSQQLLQRDNWSGIVGAVIDASSPTAELRDVHQEVCQCIAASQDALCLRIGYYLVFSVPLELTAVHHTFMSDVRRDARETLALDDWIVGPGFECTSDAQFEGALKYFVALMGQIARLTA
jgi:hypothetical protein